MPVRRACQLQVVREPRGEATGPESAAGVDIDARPQHEFAERADADAPRPRQLEHEEIAAMRARQRCGGPLLQARSLAMNAALAGQSAANSLVARIASGALSRATLR